MSCATSGFWEEGGLAVGPDREGIEVEMGRCNRKASCWLRRPLMCDSERMEWQLVVLGNENVFVEALGSGWREWQ